MDSNSSNPTAPRQERSRATRDRILAALARLLDAKTFDQISVAEVTEEAKCSMSSFYARFPTKDALFGAFLDRFFEFSAGEVGSVLSQIATGDAGPASRARLLIEFFLRSYRGYRGLLRSLILHDRTHPDSGFGVRTRDYKQQVARVALALVLGKDANTVDPGTVTSAGFGLWLVVQAIEQIVLFDDPMMGRGQISDRQLVEELTSILLRAIEQPAKERQ
jgi:AcrR family transcriptional regulator